MRDLLSMAWHFHAKEGLNRNVVWRAMQVRLSAPDYVNQLFDWVEEQVDDERIFPQSFDAPFPSKFLAVIQTIYKRLFRVYGHIYHSHFKQVCSLGEEAHLNTCFKHFIFFSLHYGLIEDKELAPLQELIDQFTGRSAR